MPSLGARALAAAAGPLLLAPAALGNCAFGPFVEAYSPERCWVDEGDAVSMKCDDKWNSASCGMRLNAFGTKVGTGQWSMTIKAAPGSGAVTTFYLSNNGGMYDLSKPWNEVDFEIFGNTATAQGSKVWTNLFTGHMDEHNQVIQVPFDVSADFHTYTFELSDTTIKWLIDGVEYRSQDIQAFPDAQNSVRSWTFRPFVSLWGKTSKDPALGVPEFREMMGKLDWNGNPFPLIASFKSAWNPPVPSPSSEASSPSPAASSQSPVAASQGVLADSSEQCGEVEENIDYVVTHKWYRTLDNVTESGQCCSLCRQEEKCKSWTVVRPFGKFRGQCWLKGGLPSEKRAKAHVTSGLARPSEGHAAGASPGRERKFALLEAGAAAAAPAPAGAAAARAALLVAGAAALAALAGARRGRGLLLGLRLEDVAASEDDRELAGRAFE